MMEREEMHAELAVAFNELEHEAAAQARIAQAVDELVVVGQNRGPPLSEEYKAWVTHSTRQVSRKTSEAELEAIARAALKLAAAFEAMHEPALKALIETIAASEWRAFIARGGTPAPLMRPVTVWEATAPPRSLDIGYVGAVALRTLAEQTHAAKGSFGDVLPQRGRPASDGRTHYVIGLVIQHYEQIVGIGDIAPPGRVAVLERLAERVFRILHVKASPQAAIKAWLEWREKAKAGAAAVKSGPKLMVDT
jgi:hypothetical protein